ncbi:MAG: FAD dependent oxidoreductase [Acidobacteria bacterium OLB17]|nr:MAG: FAD dependent oxidoreductase [Acidobacteria bacterium OLB17]MCZ2389883.1 FAD-binding oxidoreductase [Acidobacteriota bacterium]
MRSAKIIIIGGGVVGASAAYHLAMRGETDVVILERGSIQGTGSTGRATGGVRSQFETEINVRMSLYSVDFFRNCEFSTGYDPKGYLFFSTDTSVFEQMKRNAVTQAAFGVEGIEILDADGIRKMIPAMNCDDIVGGVFGASDGFINPVAVMSGFSRRAIDLGAQIVLGRSVSRINVAGGRVAGVSMPDGEIGADAVVVCAGAWSRGLAESAGVNIPVEPLRRQIVWARCKDRVPENLPMVIDAGSGFHFRPAIDFWEPEDKTGSGRDILFAYPDRDERPSFNTEFDETFAKKVYEMARKRARFLFESEPEREKCRAGLYENTPDHHAIIGACGVEGLYFATGFSGHGVMHSPAAGRAISEIILDGEASFLDVKCLSPERFERGELLKESGYI